VRVNPPWACLALGPSPAASSMFARGIPSIGVRPVRSADGVGSGALPCTDLVRADVPRGAALLARQRRARLRRLVAVLIGALGAGSVVTFGYHAWSGRARMSPAAIEMLASPLDAPAVASRAAEPAMVGPRQLPVTVPVRSALAASAAEASTTPDLLAAAADSLSSSRPGGSPKSRPARPPARAQAAAVISGRSVPQSELHSTVAADPVRDGYAPPTARFGD